MPKLTICITTYNRWDSCYETLKSICRQTEQDIEIILVDDCSTTNMPETLKKYIKDNTVKYIRHENNSGLSSARNTAIKNATGIFFSFCDDDDIWPNNMAKRMLDAMEIAPDDVKLGVILDDSRKSSCHSILSNYPDLFSVMKSGFTPPVSSQIYCTKTIRDCGGYDTNIKSGVDHDLWITLAEFNPKVATCWGESAKIAEDFSVVRMTTVESKRRNNIRDSLDIWKPKIVRIFGDNFYKYFKKSYNQYLNYNFFIKSVKNKEYINAMWRIIHHNLYGIIISKIYFKITQQRQCNTFPKYHD